jgi:hypothetical protein
METWRDNDRMLGGWADIGVSAYPHLTSWMRSQHNHFSQPFRVK